MKGAARRLAAGLLATFALTACDPQPKDTKVPVPTPPPTAAADPLGPRPDLAAAKPFQAPSPQIYRTASGLTVWLIERPRLPLVAMTLVVPTGSTADPAGKSGLAHITASMLDEGAGDRGAIDISNAINDLGASLWTHAGLDGSRVSLTVLKKHLPKAFSIFADVVARPRFDDADWKRTHALWVDRLKKRADSPRSVSRLVRNAVAYGADTAYGNPSSGRVDSASAISHRVYDRQSTREELTYDGLAAYGQSPLFRTVCIDRGFYAPLPVADLH